MNGRQALDLDSKNCDAFVARGAALANKRDFESAAHDLKSALGADEVNKTHVGVLGFLSEI